MSREELQTLIEDVKEIKKCLLGEMVGGEPGLKAEVEKLKKDRNNLMSKIFDWILRFVILALVAVATVQKIKG